MFYGKLELWSPEKGERDSLATALVTTEPSMTVQSQAEDADINVIMERFGITGLAPQVPIPPSYGDFDGVSDYRTALHVMQEARDSFEMLPAKLRNRFENDPAKFLDFVYDPQTTRVQLEELGMVLPAVEPAPQKVEIVGPNPLVAAKPQTPAGGV